MYFLVFIGDPAFEAAAPAAVKLSKIAGGSQQNTLRRVRGNLTRHKSSTRISGDWEIDGA